VIHGLHDTAQERELQQMIGHKHLCLAGHGKRCHLQCEHHIQERCVVCNDHQWAICRLERLPEVIQALHIHWDAAADQFESETEGDIGKSYDYSGKTFTTT